jgi:hypothetical protein
VSGRSLIADRKLELRVFSDAENAALTAGDIDAAVRANVDTCVARGLAVAAAAHANAPVRVAGPHGTLAVPGI